jgi:hypothetical protein
VAAHLYEPRRSSDPATGGRYAAPAAAKPAPEPMPDPRLVAADIRIAAIHRMQQMSVKHAQRAWERRRSDPLSAHGLAFLYIQPDNRPGRQQRYRLCAATKLWLAGEESSDLPGLLLALATAVEEHRSDPSFDPRWAWANRTDSEMTRAAFFAGLGISSLDTYTGTWDEVQTRVTKEQNIPASLRIVVSDGTIAVCERRGLDEYNELTVRTTEPLGFAYGQAPFPWGNVTAQELLADEYHKQPLLQLLSLSDRLWHQDQRRLAHLAAPAGGSA